MKKVEGFKYVEFPRVLSNAQQTELFKQYRENTDMDARDSLIESNLKMVIHMANKYKSFTENDNSIDIEDLISVGMEALIKAVDSFDINKNTKFATYAYRCISNNILCYLRKRKGIYDVSIHERVSVNGEEEDIYLIDVLRDKNDSTEAFIDAEESKYLSDLLCILTERERLIFTLYYGIGCESASQSKIAKQLNVSRSSISKILKKATIKLRDEIKNKPFELKRI
jgi:RNA polymerase sporulation-specific sigma factor